MKEGNSAFMPHAREAELACHELSDEMLVYDLKRHKAHCLNPTATQVWKHCDGQTTVKEIARRLEQECQVPVEEEVVWLALDRLGRAHLLRERVSKPDQTSGLTRRAAMRKLGVTAAIALPLVTSIIAPMAVQAATCLNIGMGAACSAAECGLLCNSCEGMNACGSDTMSATGYSCKMTPVTC
jgi:hypothetical protein